MVPAKQNRHGQQRQQKILAEAHQIEQLAEPNVGSVAHGLRAEPQNATFVEDQQRRHERQASERSPRLLPIIPAGLRPTARVPKEGRNHAREPVVWK